MQNPPPKLPSRPGLVPCDMNDNDNKEKSKERQHPRRGEGGKGRPRGRRTAQGILARMNPPFPSLHLLTHWEAEAPRTHHCPPPDHSLPQIDPPHPMEPHPAVQCPQTLHPPPTLRPPEPLYPSAPTQTPPALPLPTPWQTARAIPRAEAVAAEHDVAEHAVARAPGDGPGSGAVGLSPPQIHCSAIQSPPAIDAPPSMQAPPPP